MKSSPGKTFLLLVLCLVCFGVAASLQHHNVVAFRKKIYKFEDKPYLPSSGYAQVLAVGYDNFAADFLWLGMIQSFASSYSVPDCAPLMHRYFNTISDLDPRFIAPYSFAIMGVGEEGQRYDLVKKIVEKSVLKLPGNSHVTYEGAFNANWTQNDQETARYWVRLAKLDPGYPEFIDRWEGYFDLKQGRYRAAYEKYMRDYVGAIIGGNDAVSNVLEGTVRSTADSWIKAEIKDRVVQWQKETGKIPTVAEMEAAGKFKGVLLPDIMMQRQLVAKLSEQDAATRRQNSPEEVNKVAQLVAHPFDHLPPGPYDLVWPYDPGYVVWRDLPTTDTRFVLSGLEALTIAQPMAGRITSLIEAYKTNHGTLPARLEDVLTPDIPRTDPFGQPWLLDAANNRVGMVKYPDIHTKQLPPI